MEVLSISSISISIVQNAIMWLWPLKSVRCGGIPSLVIKDSYEIYLYHSLSWNTLPNLWKQADIVPISEKDYSSCVGSYRPIANLNNLSEVF
jgi:hypothetical protein